MAATTTTGQPRHLRWFTTRWAVLIGAVVAALVFLSVVRWHPQGDFEAHMDIVKKAGGSLDLFAYSLYYPAEYVLSLGGRSQAVMEIATIVLGVAFVAARVWVAGWYGRTEGLSDRIAGFIALIVTVAMPIFDPRGLVDRDRLDDIYLGQLSPNVWHNITTVMMVPLAVAALALGVRYVMNPSRTGLWQFGLVALGSTLMKPNFTIVLIPTVGLMMLWRVATASERSEPLRHLVNLAVAVVPSGIALVIQYLLTYSRDESLGVVANSLVIDPLQQWNTFTDNVPLSLARSIALPAIVTVVLVIHRRVSAMTVASWIALTAAVALFAVLSEEDKFGQTVYHGNWYWAVVPATFALYLSTLVDYARDTIERVRDGGTRWTGERVLVTAVVVLSTVSGIYYIVGLITGDVSYGIFG